MVAVELEEIAGQLVGSGLRDGVDRRARVHTVLCGETARRDPELLERVRERQRQVRVVLRVVMHRAVEQVGDAERKAAGDGEVGGPREAPAVRASRVYTAN